MLGAGSKAIFTFWGTQGRRNPTQEQTHEEEERKQQQEKTTMTTHPPPAKNQPTRTKQPEPHHNPQPISLTQTLSGTEIQWQFQRDKVISPMKGKALKSPSEK